MARGTAERVRVAGVAGLGALIEDADAVPGARARRAARGPAGQGRGRHQDNDCSTAPRPTSSPAPAATSSITGAPAFVLLDFDTKGMPPAVAAELERRGGFWPALVSVLPALGGVARVDAALDQRRALSRADTGEHAAGIGRRCTSTSRCRTAPTSSASCKTLHERCWLAGSRLDDGRRQRAVARTLDRRPHGRCAGAPGVRGRPDPGAAAARRTSERRRPVAVDGDAARHAGGLPAAVDRRAAQLRGAARPRTAQRLAAGSGARRARRSSSGRPSSLVERTGMSEKAARADRRAAVRGRPAARCRAAVRRSRAWPAAPSPTCWPTRSGSRARPWPIRSRASSTAAARPRSCAAPTARRGSIRFAHGRTIYELKHDAAARAQGDAKQAAKDDVVDDLRRARRRRRSRRRRDRGSCASWPKKLLRHRPARRSTPRSRRRGSSRPRQQAEETRNAPARRSARDPRPLIQAPPPTRRGCRRWAMLNEVLGDVAADHAASARHRRRRDAGAQDPGPEHARLRRQSEPNERRTTNDQAAAARAMGALRR